MAKIKLELILETDQYEECGGCEVMESLSMKEESFKQFANQFFVEPKIEKCEIVEVHDSEKTISKERSEERKSFKQAATPLVKWAEENCCPHDVIIVDNMGAQLLQGKMAFPSEYNKRINNLKLESEEE